MTTENLKKANEILEEINVIKKQIEEMEFVLNCLSHDNCKSAKIKILALSDNGNLINKQNVEHPVEVGNVIDVIKDSLTTFSNRVIDLEYQFKKL